MAGLLGMTTDWVYREVRAGRLPHIRLGRYVRFRPESIDALAGRRLLSAACGPGRKGHSGRRPGGSDRIEKRGLDARVVIR